LRQAACPEDLDYGQPRGLDRAQIRSRATGRWLAEHNNVLLLGLSGAVKNFVACALGNQAARRLRRAGRPPIRTPSGASR